MSTASMSIKGLTYYNSEKACAGVTLFSPVDGTGIWLIDMLGRVISYWEMGYKPGCYGELLPGGRLLYGGKVEDGPLADLEGAGGVLLEVDWEGKVLWEYKDPYLHHAFYRMRNGNTLVLKWVNVPSEIAAKVEGGIPGSEREGVMWGDAIQEISPDGKVVWEWIGHEHLDPSPDAICPICPRSTWTHINSVVELPDGNVLANFMKTNTIAIIDKKTGNIKWRWGADELGHPHCLSILDNGNILLFDNGLHASGVFVGFSRVLEVDPDTGKTVWLYGSWGDVQTFYSPIISSCQRLPNGNTLICEGTRGRLFEVTGDGELVWEYINGLPPHETSPIESKHCPVYAAYRYEIGYSGLKRPVPLPEARQSAPGTTAPAETKKTVWSRLELLGY